MSPPLRPRRTVLPRVALAGALAAILGLLAPLAAFAQRPVRVVRLGILSPATRDTGLHLRAALLQGFRQAGYVEGENLLIEERYADARTERIPALAAELLQRPLDALITWGNSPTLAAKQATATVPIVMVGTLLPVQVGLVASLARPGGNVTGLSLDVGAEFAGKLFELIRRDLAPTRSRVAVLVGVGTAGMHPWLDHPRATLVREIEAAAQALGITAAPVLMTGADDLDRALAAVTRQRAEALVVDHSYHAFLHRRAIADFARSHRLPSVGSFREFAEAGGLLAYGADLKDLARRVATYVDRILGGAKPAELPVQQPTRFELVINATTAKALGITLPDAIRLRADDVID